MLQQFISFKILSVYQVIAALNVTYTQLIPINKKGEIKP